MRRATCEPCAGSVALNPPRYPLRCRSLPEPHAPARRAPHAGRVGQTATRAVCALPRPAPHATRPGTVQAAARGARRGAHSAARRACSTAEDIAALLELLKLSPDLGWAWGGAGQQGGDDADAAETAAARGALERFAGACECRFFRPGEVMLPDGAAPRFAGVLVSGAAEALVRRAGGRALPCAQLLPGDAFGAAGMLFPLKAATALRASARGALAAVVSRVPRPAPPRPAPPRPAHKDVFVRVLRTARRPRAATPRARARAHPRG